MVRKILVSTALAGALLVSSGCHHKVQNPLANIDSKQPDKGLFDRAMDSMKRGKYQESRTLLDTLINTYPDSEYIARAKLALGDAWYAEGGKAAWSQAEVEYKDFQTFFPNLPEASEAQLKIASMHYRQMEKPDRDYAEAARAAEEYKAIDTYSKIITRYPAMDRVPDAKRRLEALKAPVPNPTPEALAESKAEESSRGKVGLVARVTGNFKKHPNVAPATGVGEPNLNEETVKSAPAVINEMTNQINGTQPSQSVGIQAVGAGNEKPAANEKAPGTQGSAPATDGTAPPPAPAQVNEVQKPQGVDVTQDPATGQQKMDPKQESSSKKKGKKGLRKLIPF